MSQDTITYGGVRMSLLAAQAIEQFTDPDAEIAADLARWTSTATRSTSC